jgi:aryl-alcohol dehydrogenase-like predicted oxidoreductase
MLEHGGERVSRRPVPGTRLRASSLGLTLSASRLGSPASDPRTVQLLRNARSLGITTFQLPEGPGARRAERILSAAFPSPDTDLVVLVGRSVSSLAEEGARSAEGETEQTWETRLRQSIEACSARLHPLSVSLVEWRPAAEDGPRLGDAARTLERLRSEGVVAGWVLAVPPGEVLPSQSSNGPHGAVTLFSGAFSPMNASLRAPLAERATAGSVGLFAQDPLDAGRLDGTRFTESVAYRRPEGRPVNVRDLRREFDPVLRLGFLTAGHARTLAQASLRFVLHWPWVCSAVIPLPAPERLDELTRTESTPPLSDAEIARVLAFSP